MPLLAAAATLGLAAPAVAAGGGTTGADIQMSGTVSNSSPPAGSALTFTYQIKNKGPDTATAVRFDSPLPSGIVYNSATANGNPSACQIGNDPSVNGQQSMLCALGDMPNGAQTTVVINATAPTTAQTYGNSAIASSPNTTDLNGTNNTVLLEIKVVASGGGGGGGGGGTTTLAPGPCATVSSSSATQTTNGVDNKMDTVVTSCSSQTQTNLVVVWDTVGGPNYAFGCVAPQVGPSQLSPGLSFSLAPGASTKVNCQTASLAGNVTQDGSGTGTVTLYNNCESFDSQSNTNLELGDVSLLDTSHLCSEEPSTQLAQAPFSWTIAIPAGQPPQGGNRGGG